MVHMEARRMIKVYAFLSLLCSSFIGRVQAFTVRGSYLYPSHRLPRITMSAITVLEPVASFLVAGDGPTSLSDFLVPATDLVTGSPPDLAGKATDLAGSAQASIGDSFGYINHAWSSVINTVTSTKDQATDATVESVEAMKAQMNGLGENMVSPFQRLSQYLSTSVTGGLDSLNSGARGAMEGAQTQLDQSFSEKIGHPIEEGLQRLFSRFGASPEELLKEEESLTNSFQKAVQELEKVATPSTLFYAENAAILPLWAGMIIWPEKPLTKAVMSTYAPVVAAALVYIWLTYESFQNPVALQGFASGITNLGGLTKGFGEEVSVATAWSHFLAEDLFIGRWVYLDGRRNGVFNKHSLALCYLFGPAGLLSHLLTRTAFSIVKSNVRDIDELGNPQELKATTEAPTISVTTPTAGDESTKILASARREAEAIIKQARSEGAAQAVSLLEAAETEALDILKGAEVERSALLKGSKSKPASFSSVGDEMDKISIEPAARADTKPAQEMKATPRNRDAISEETGTS